MFVHFKRGVLCFWLGICVKLNESECLTAGFAEALGGGCDASLKIKRIGGCYRGGNFQSGLGKWQV